MDFGFVVSVFFYYSLFTYLAKNVSAAHRSLEIIKDRMRVEELAVEQALHKESWKSKIKKPISMIRKNICDKPGDMKVALCQKFLPLDYMGFKFHTWVETDLTCAATVFSIKYLRNQERDSFKLAMYACPKLKFINLETDEDKFIPERYYIAKGKKHNTAILFVIKDSSDSNDRIYPRKYMKHITFEELLRPPTVQPDYQLPHVHGLRRRASGAVEAALYGAARIIRKPYNKFRKMYYSMNICGLPKAYKVHLCRKIHKTYYPWDSAPLQLEGYDQHLCPRHRLRAPLMESEYFLQTGKDLPKEMHASLLLCPTKRQPTDPKIIQSFLYLSSSLHSYSTMSLTRLNDWDRKISWDRIYYDLDTSEMVTDRRRLRKLMYPLEIDRRKTVSKLQRDYQKEFENYSNWISTSAQTPLTMAMAGQLNWADGLGPLIPAPITREEPLVEDILISYSEIKAMKLVYNRFMKTYWSLDICGLPHKLKKELCDDILKRKPFEYYRKTNAQPSNESFHSVDLYLKDDYQLYPPDKNINRACSRRQVNLGVREIDRLKAQYFPMWHCSRANVDGGYTRTYFIAKSHLKNALLLFKTCDALRMEDIIFPDAVATEIDRTSLAQILIYD